MQKHIYKQGFSIIEILAVIAIIAIMAVAVAPTYSGFRKNRSLALAKKQIEADVKLVQSYALSGYIPPVGGLTVTPAGGFALEFVRGGDAYALYADVNGDGKIQTTGTGATDVKIKEVSFAELNLGGVRLRNLTPSNTIYFYATPPYGRTILKGADGGTATFRQATLELWYNGDASTISTLTLTPAGASN